MGIRDKAWRRFNVAVTGMNANPESPGPGYAVARCLREHPEFAGRVVGLGYDVLDAGLYARHICDAGYLVPYPSAGKDALIERIKEIVKFEQIDVIIPCLDAEIQNFIALRAQLAEMGIRMLIPTAEQFTLRAKDQLGKFCQSIGVLAPESKTVTNPNFFDDCQKHGWEYPLMVKGIFYDAALARDAAEARAIMYRLVQSWGYPVLVQKVVRGDEFDLSAIGDGHGQMLGTVSMRKRALTEKGKAWAGVTVAEPGVAEAAQKIISGLNWSGPFEVEVMRSQDEEIYLIEINPRFPVWIYLSHAVGRNLPIALLKVLAEEKEFDFDQVRTGTFFIRHAQELIVRLPEFEAMLIDGGIPSPTASAAAAIASAASACTVSASAASASAVSAAPACAVSACAASASDGTTVDAAAIGPAGAVAATTTAIADAAAGFAATATKAERRASSSASH